MCIPVLLIGALQVTANFWPPAPAYYKVLENDPFIQGWIRLVLYFVTLAWVGYYALGSRRDQWFFKLSAIFAKVDLLLFIYSVFDDESCQ